MSKYSKPALITCATLFSATNVMAHEPETLSKVNLQVENSAIEQYWSEERMNAAIPMPMPNVTTEELNRMLNLQPGLNEVIESSRVKDDLSSNGTPTRADVGQRPFWNGGKFFFTKDTGGDYVCSAEFVGNNRTIMTAAHCVFNATTKQWYKNFLFRRAYNNGGGQKVGWECLSIKTAYYSPSKNYAYDYAFIYGDRDSGAGWLGYKSQIPYSSWTSIGYPVNYGNTQYMYKVVGTKGSNSGGVVQMKGNPMGGGSSGGAWIGDLTTPVVGGNYAIGLNSFHYTSEPNDEYSPLFNTTTYNLLTKVMGKGCM